jgi:hypothetical protein
MNNRSFAKIQLKSEFALGSAKLLSIQCRLVSCALTPKALSPRPVGRATGREKAVLNETNIH